MLFLSLSFIWWTWKRRGRQGEPNPVMTLGGNQFGPSELRWYYWEPTVWESPAWHCDLSRVNSGIQIPLWAVSICWCLCSSEDKDFFITSGPAFPGGTDAYFLFCVDHLSAQVLTWSRWCIWGTCLFALRYGTLPARKSTTAWSHFTTGEPTLHWWSTISADG